MKMLAVMRGLSVTLIVLSAVARPAAAEEPTMEQVIRWYNEARKFKAEGEFGGAIALYERIVPNAPRIFGAGSIDHATTLGDLASLYNFMGRYDDAEPLYKSALAIIESKLGKVHPYTATALGNLAILYQNTGRTSDAEPLFKRALAIDETKLAKDHPNTAISLNNLAELYRATGRDAAAEPLLKRALAITEAKLGKDHPATATCLNNLAMLYYETSRYAEAEPMLKRSLAIDEARLGKDHPNSAGTLNNLAMLYKDKGQYTDAEALYKRSLAIKERSLGRDNRDTALSLINLAFLQVLKGAKPQEASDYLNDARRVVRRHVSRVLPGLGEKDQLGFLKADRRDLHAAFTFGLQNSDDSAIATRSAGWLLNSKAIAQQTLAQSALAARDSRDPKIGQAVIQLQEARRELARLSLSPAKPGQEEVHRLRREAALAREQQLAEQMRRAGAAVEVGDPWVDIDSLRAALPPRAVFIDIARFDEFKLKAERNKKWLPAHYVAWVTPKTGAVKVIDLGPADAIDEAVAAARKAIDTAPKRLKAIGEVAAEKEARTALAALSKLVLDPLHKHIDRADQWVICPDGSLWLTPWASLQVDDKTFAIEKHPIQLVVSGRDIIPRPAAPKSTGTPVMFADPDFDNGSVPPADPVKGGGTRSLAGMKLGNVPRLPGTAAEAEDIAEQLLKMFRAKPKLFTERAATTAAFRALDRPRLLTLATHGFFLPTQELTAEEREKLSRNPNYKPATQVEDPLLRCGLLLAGCNKPSATDTGVLTGREVLSADLRGCQLVVLSACETGLGDVRNGEGVAGLRQAFMLAGAESVLASLWKVPDTDTALLMTATFDNLGKGQGRAEALRQAQLARISERRDKFGAAHPYFWAAFTLTGDASPLGK